MYRYRFFTMTDRVLVDTQIESALDNRDLEIQAFKTAIQTMPVRTRKLKEETDPLDTLIRKALKNIPPEKLRELGLLG